MNKFLPVSFALLAALLLAGSALAQADRADRRCTSAPLSADPAAPCPDDVLNDGSGVPGGSRSPGNTTAGSVNTTAGIPTPISPGSTGAASTGAMGNTGAGSTGTSAGTTGTPSTGTVSPGTSSVPGATGSGAASVGGAAGTPARR